MCGIAGILKPDGTLPAAADLKRMTRMLAHRGPDEEGYYLAAGVGLGHRRLSIIDLEGGQQPMRNEDRSVWTVFNGEIFNYIELREALVKMGHVFRSRSDTEVIVHLYEEYGPDFVERLNGQFAIAVWDAPKRRLVLARDRVGIRPLFYSRRPDGSLLFASEMKAIFAHPGVERAIDPAGVAQTSLFWVSVPPRTIFKGIEELGPGRCLVCEDGRIRTVQYWRHRFPDADDFEDKPLWHWTGRLRELLRDSTALQLRSDVPVAAYLSGGIDSSIICALVKKHHDNDLITFSVGFADERFDERAYQSRMVEHLETDHRMIQVDHAAIGQDFGEAIRYAERPMMRTAPAPLLSLSRLVRSNGIKVVLTGEGADELFGGYDIFKEDKVRRFWARNPVSAFRPLALNALYGDIRRDAQAEGFWKMFFRKGLEDVDNPYYSHLIRWNNSARMRLFFHPDLKARFPSDEETFAELDAYLDPDRSRWHPLNRAQYLEMSLFMSCYLLNSQGDRMMMGNSVEGRFPFLDHRLIEFAATVPPKYKINGLTEKYALRKSCGDLVPAAIANRAKKPYRAPISPCFRGESLAARAIRPESLEKAGLVDAAAFGKLMRKAGEDGSGLSEREEMAVAMVVSLQLLNHHFLDPIKEAGAPA